MFLDPQTIDLKSSTTLLICWAFLGRASPQWMFTNCQRQYTSFKERQSELFLGGFTFWQWDCYLNSTFSNIRMVLTKSNYCFTLMKLTQSLPLMASSHKCTPSSILWLGVFLKKKRFKNLPGIWKHGNTFSENCNSLPIWALSSSRDPLAPNASSWITNTVSLVIKYFVWVAITTMCIHWWSTWTQEPFVLNEG